MTVTCGRVGWCRRVACRLQVVLADDCDEYHMTYEECLVFNPGSFPRDTGFMVYRPSSRETEISRVRDDAAADA